MGFARVNNKKQRRPNERKGPKPQTLDGHVHRVKINTACVPEAHRVGRAQHVHVRVEPVDKRDAVRDLDGLDPLVRDAVQLCLCRFLLGGGGKLHVRLCVNDATTHMHNINSSVKKSSTETKRAFLMSERRELACATTRGRCPSCRAGTISYYDVRTCLGVGLGWFRWVGLVLVGL